MLPKQRQKGLEKFVLQVPTKKTQSELAQYWKSGLKKKASWQAILLFYPVKMAICDFDRQHVMNATILCCQSRKLLSKVSPNRSPNWFIRKA
jgi:hypothetical protein